MGELTAIETMLCPPVHGVSGFNEVNFESASLLDIFDVVYKGYNDDEDVVSEVIIVHNDLL